MKGQLNVKTPAEYLAKLEEPRRSEVAALDALIRKTAPKLESLVHNGFLGYGPFRYKYPSGREGDSFRIAIASNASYISLYVGGSEDGCYVDKSYHALLPKAKIGKCCVRFKRIGDLDQRVLEKLIREAAARARKA